MCGEGVCACDEENGGAAAGGVAECDDGVMEEVEGQKEER